MILRKPYAFFIKHFRLIHMILAVLVSYSLYRTKIVLDFFNEYALINMSVVGQELVETYLYGVIFWIPIFIILITGLILVVMSVKEKPYVFYTTNIIIYIYVLIILFVTRSTLADLELTIIGVRTIRLVRDLILISFIAQIYSAIIIFIRAVGFDIKKFDFKRDLQELNINEKDREEFEVELEIDQNKTRRSFRKSIRFLKYFLKENRLVVTLISGGIIVGIAFMIFLSYKGRQPIFEQNTYFTGNYFKLSITDSYLTNEDYNGNIIDEDYYYLILRTDIKSTKLSSIPLDLATTKVIIDKFVYTPVLEEKSLLFDFGNIYNDELIGTEYETKDLIYKIPKQLIEKEMVFSYVKKNKVGTEKYDDVKVNINYKKIIDNEIETYKMNDNVTFDDVLNGYELIINEIDLDKRIKINYNYCISNNCFPSYEYAFSSLTSNYDKAILKLKGILTIGDVRLSNINDLYDFIDKFGKLHYVINGEEKEQNINFKEVIVQKTKQSNVYYIEVIEEVLNAEKISILFETRDKNFEYILK